MSYTANNTSVYLSAFAGCLAGLGSVDATSYALMADAYAQQFDKTWGQATPTQFELMAIEQASTTVWAGRSPLATGVASAPGSYASIVDAVITLVQQGNNQVVGQGVDPNGTRAVVNPTSWSAPLWVFDPINGNDSNLGTSQGSPLKTWSGLIAKYQGSTTPTLTQRTSFLWLNSQLDSSDPIVFNPVLIGGGGYQFAGTPTQVATATITSVQVQNTAAGIPNQIATNRTGAFWTPYVGLTVHDITAGAQFVVESDLGNGQAQISAPKVYPVTEFGVDTPIEPNDSLVILTLPTIYPVALDNTGFGNGSGGGASVAQLNISGDFGVTLGSGVSLVECTINQVSILPRRSADAEAGPVFTSCYFGVGGLGGAPFSGAGAVYGGAMHTPGNNFKDGSILDGDVLCMQRIHTQGTVKIGRCYWGQTNTLDNPPTIYNVLNQNAGSARLWGPGGLSLVKGSKCLLTGVTADNALLLTGTLALDGQATGWPWVAGSSAYGSPVSITPSAIDAAGGLSNPATGSAFLFG